MYTTSQFFSLLLWFLDSAGKEELTQPKDNTYTLYYIDPGTTQWRGENRLRKKSSSFIANVFVLIQKI